MQVDLVLWLHLFVTFIIQFRRFFSFSFETSVNLLDGFWQLMELEHGNTKTWDNISWSDLISKKKEQHIQYLHFRKTKSKSQLSIYTFPYSFYFGLGIFFLGHGKVKATLVRNRIELSPSEKFFVGFAFDVKVLENTGPRLFFVFELQDHVEEVSRICNWNLSKKKRTRHLKQFQKL
jgi:hypothetical protein